jgi:hypothetical protein
MLAKLKIPGKASQPPHLEGSSKSSRDSPSSPLDLSAMGALMEQLAAITSRLDAKAADTRQLMQRVALRDHLALC